jgi:hypothetical protein
MSDEGGQFSTSSINAGTLFSFTDNPSSPLAVGWTQVVTSTFYVGFRKSLRARA